MRDPSIHITESQLTLVLQRVMEDREIPVLDYKELAKAIIYESRGISCNNRSVQITNARLEKKAKQIITADKADSFLLSGIIYNIRRKLKHRGIKRIEEGDRDWGQLKELVDICIDFCNEFGLEKRKGFIQYLEIAFSKITSTRQYLTKFKNMSESISQEYGDMLEILEDDNPQETREIHDLYVETIAKRTGIPETYDKQPNRYIYFKKVRELTDQLNIPYDIFIDAQFEGLAWADSFPGPAQLIGDRAIERLNKYMYNRKMTRGKKEQKEGKLSDILKRIRDDNN